METFTIVEITDWEKQEDRMDGDYGHMSKSNILKTYAEEYERKVEKGEWPNLPFTCEAEDKEEAIEKYNEENCEYDYICAIDADFEE